MYKIYYEDLSLCIMIITNLNNLVNKFHEQVKLTQHSSLIKKKLTSNGQTIRFERKILLYKN